MKEGDVFSHDFIITQEMVNKFAELSGDTNPIHTDEVFAAGTVFKKPIVHGIFTASVFSKILGTTFPGDGSIYLSQNMQFLRPVFPGHPYIAIFTIQQIDYQKHRAVIRTQVTDAVTGKSVIDGEAGVMNNRVFVQTA